MMSDAPAPHERFWLLTGEVPGGPFTVAQVHAELDAGRATWQTPACPVGGSTWLPLVQTPGIGPVGPPRAVTDAHAPSVFPSESLDSAPSPVEPAVGSLEGVFAAKSPVSAHRSPSSPDAPFVSAVEATAQRDQTPASPPASGPNHPNQFWLLVGSETTGPFRPAHIRAKLQSGELSPEAKARRVGTEEWVSLTEAVGALPPRPPAGAKSPPASEPAGAPFRQQKVDAEAPPATKPATPIEVRCGCGQLVYAEERFADRNVQCPHCKASVAVPVATASSAPPTPPAQPETPIEGAASVAGGVIGLVVLAACSDALPAGVVKILGFVGLMAIVGGLVVLFGGRRSDLFR